MTCHNSNRLVQPCALSSNKVNQQTRIFQSKRNGDFNRAQDERAWKVVANFNTFMGRVIQELKKPKNKAEYLVYLCLFAVAMNSMGANGQSDRGNQLVSRVNVQRSCPVGYLMVLAHIFPNLVDPYKEELPWQITEESFAKRKKKTCSTEGNTYTLSEEELKNIKSVRSEIARREKNFLSSLLKQNKVLQANRQNAIELTKRLKVWGTEKLNFPIGSHLCITKEEFVLQVPNFPPSAEELSRQA